MKILLLFEEDGCHTSLSGALVVPENLRSISKDDMIENIDAAFHEFSEKYIDNDKLVYPADFIKSLEGSGFKIIPSKDLYRWRKPT